ncbi:MAG: hypothetical protein HFH91_10855 [Lachnospiraceae bacterium]|nr:hypothetical protein [Lachnospiraceae bacterium]
MLIKNKIYQPIILTIPEDTSLFSVLNPDEKMTSKIIMENFIDFYCFKVPTHNFVYFRFENYMDYSYIEGIRQAFIPIDMLKNYFDALQTIFHFLANGYVLSMPIVKKNISFYKQSEGMHPMFIYGADTSRQVLFCKDFSGHLFAEFEASFEDMKNSLSNYDMANLRALDGLLAFRMDDKASREIEYSKVYSEFHKLRTGYASANDGYGLGAIDLYVNRVVQYPCEVSPIDRWYVIANYLRESAKLMRMRYCILEKEFQEKRIEKPLDTLLLKKLIQDTDILFFTISKLQMKGSIASSEIIDRLCTLTNICRNDFQMFAEYICEVVCNTMSLK